MCYHLKKKKLFILTITYNFRISMHVLNLEFVTTVMNHNLDMIRRLLIRCNAMVKIVWEIGQCPHNTAKLFVRPPRELEVSRGNWNKSDGLESNMHICKVESSSPKYLLPQHMLACPHCLIRPQGLAYMWVLTSVGPVSSILNTAQASIMKVLYIINRNQLGYVQIFDDIFSSDTFIYHAFTYIFIYAKPTF